MYYQSKNYITTEVLIACAAAKRSREKRNTTPLAEVKELLENTTATN